MCNNVSRKRSDILKVIIKRRDSVAAPSTFISTLYKNTDLCVCMCVYVALNNNQVDCEFCNIYQKVNIVKFFSFLFRHNTGCSKSPGPVEYFINYAF